MIEEETVSEVSVEEMSPAAWAVESLLKAVRRRSRTVQWMPADQVGPERFEVIVVADGSYEQVVSIDPDLGVVFDDLAILLDLRGRSCATAT